MVIIVFIAGLLLGVLLGVLIMSLFFLSQKGDKEGDLSGYHLANQQDLDQQPAGSPDDAPKGSPG